MALYKGVKTDNIKFLVEETKLKYGDVQYGEVHNLITLEDKVISEEELEELIAGILNLFPNIKYNLE